MQLKRVSSEEIKRNYTQITGREALERLLAGEEVFSAKWADSWKIIENGLQTRECANDGDFEPCTFDVNGFLDPEDDDWYVAPPFDARKEMLARPGEWVAKYFDESFGGFVYIGFDMDHMIAVGSSVIETPAEFNQPVIPVISPRIDTAIPLDDADLAKLASLSKEGE